MGRARSKKMGKDDWMKLTGPGSRDPEGRTVRKQNSDKADKAPSDDMPYALKGGPKRRKYYKDL